MKQKFKYRKDGQRNKTTNRGLSRTPAQRRARLRRRKW